MAVTMDLARVVDPDCIAYNDGSKIGEFVGPLLRQEQVVTILLENVRKMTADFVAGFFSGAAIPKSKLKNLKLLNAKAEWVDLIKKAAAGEEITGENILYDVPVRKTSTPASVESPASTPDTKKKKRTRGKKNA